MLVNINNNEIKLPPSLQAIVEVFNDNPNEYVNTLGFLRAGVLSSAAGLAKLKNLGAIIVTERKSVTDATGTLRKNVAHYKLVGWSL
ncbi:MAG: hypothetical protein P8O76_03720 [Methylophilaceae bacterium]|nr:hypothetical protein [Methylophilaceae bacterium]